MKTKKLVSWSLEENIAIILIDNPPLNVLEENVVKQLGQSIEEIQNNEYVKAVIITGSGEKAFVAGGDIKGFPELIGKGKQLAKEKSLWLQAPLNKIQQMACPTIAALNGNALGGGCELALSCDFRIAEEQIKIGLPEIKLGLIPGAGGTQRLSRLIGLSKAKEMIFTGDLISAIEAKEIGLVNDVVLKGEALKKSIELANRMTKYSSVTISLAKHAIEVGLEQSLEQGLITEAELLGEVFQTEDIEEGVQAFIEKRQPLFKNN